MHKLLLGKTDGRRTLIVRTPSEETTYAERRGVGGRTDDGRYPLGCCDCPDEDFAGLYSDDDILSGANALIAAGLPALPVRVQRFGKTHFAVEYAVAMDRHGDPDMRRLGTMWLCMDSSGKATILANGMLGVIRCCRRILLEGISVKRPTWALLLVPPDKEKHWGARIWPVPLEKISCVKRK